MNTPCVPCDQHAKTSHYGTTIPGNGAHCPSCHRTWTGERACHCASCHLTLTADWAFDAHRRDGVCLTPAQVTKRDGTPRLFEHPSKHGIAWGGPPMDSTAVAARRSDPSESDAHSAQNPGDVGLRVSAPDAQIGVERGVA